MSDIILPVKQTHVESMKWKWKQNKQTHDIIRQPVDNFFRVVEEMNILLEIAHQNFYANNDKRIQHWKRKKAISLSLK